MSHQPRSAAAGGFTLTVDAPRHMGVRHYEEPTLAGHEVRIATLHSGISAGTEMTAYRGTNPYLSKRWNGERRLFESADGTNAPSASLSYPMNAIGYEEVGRIVELGAEATDVQVGDVVWGAWGHKSSHVADAAWARQRLLAPGVDARSGIFSQIGGIALNAILDANLHIGEYVAVFGQGVPGLMVTQLAKASGAEVIAIDRLASRLAAAGECGADHLVNGAEQDVADAVMQITGGRGADVSIEISGVYPALHDAIRCTAYNSRVVVAGFFQGDGVGLALGEEFHHNRIELICSQIGGVSRTLDHRWDRLRLDTTAMQLQASGKVDFTRLISHSFPVADAQAAFTLVDEHPGDVLQVVLDFEAGAAS